MNGIPDPPKDAQSRPPSLPTDASKPRPDWLVSAEDGLSAEANSGRENKAGPPRIAADGLPRPARAKTAPPPAIPRAPVPGQPRPTPPPAPAPAAPHVASPSEGAAPGASPDSAAHGPPAAPPPAEPKRPIFPGEATGGFDIPSDSLAAEHAMPVMPPDLEQRPGSYSYGAAPAGPSPPPAEPSDADVPWVSMETAPRKERDPSSAFASYGRLEATNMAAEATLPPPRKSPLQALLANRIALLSVLVVVLAAVAIPLLLRPKGGGPGGLRTTSVAEIREHARAFDGRDVTVKGTVGLVFSVGQGHTYYLHQGRDTLIVFTRGPGPVQGSDITVSGSISTGEMDGIPRPTLFETTH